MVSIFRTALILALAAGALLAGPITVTVLPTLAPDVNGSPSWAAWQNNAIAALKSGATSYGDPSLPSYYQQQSHATYAQAALSSFHSWQGDVSPTGAFAGEYGDRMTFSAIIAGTDLFTLNNIGYQAVGTGSTLLDYIWPDLTTSFGTSVIGVIYNAGGSTSYVTSGLLSSTAVDAVLLRGRGFSPTVDCYGCTAAQRQAAMDALATQLYGLTSYTMTMTLNLSDNSQVQGSGTFTFDGAIAPEPATTALLGGALIPLLLLGRRKLSR